MADLTNIESKLGEVTGLAMAAKAATSKVSTIARNGGHDELVASLEQMNTEAAETEERCNELAGSFEGKKTAILDEARETKDKAASMLRTYLDDDSDALDGFEFLTMAEAGEVGHWESSPRWPRPRRRMGSSSSRAGRYRSSNAISTTRARRASSSRPRKTPTRKPRPL